MFTRNATNGVITTTTTPENVPVQDGCGAQEPFRVQGMYKAGPVSWQADKIETCSSVALEYSSNYTLLSFIK
jgi:hypothetical protein